MNLYWHFLTNEGTTKYGGIKVFPGQTLKIEGEPILCHRGFHASLRVLDGALPYAPGAMVQRCTLGGTIHKDIDKHVGQERTCLWIADATQVLHEFVRDTLNRDGAKQELDDMYLPGDLPIWLSACLAAKAAAKVPATITYNQADFNVAHDAWMSAWKVAMDELNADLEQRLLTLAPEVTE